MWFWLAIVCLPVTILGQKDPHWLPGRSAIVHLFEWKFNDIAAECERFLGPMGYAGVQTSPINEYLEIAEKGRPWWERYQPISYKIISRSGDEDAFADMVKRCNAVGIRIYVDAVFNQMSADWDNAHGYGGSTADTYNRQYPAVPYGPKDFHAQCNITTYNAAKSVRNCELAGLHDLNQTSDYVRGKIISYLNKLVDHGVAGFRIDAAKHMWPSDLKYIYSKVKNLSTDHGFPSGLRPFFFQEVIDLTGAEGVRKQEYSAFGTVTEFRFGTEVSNAFRGNIPIKYYENFGSEWGLLDSGSALVFIDNHDNQRGHGAGGATIINYKTPKLYKMAVAFMLSWPYGIPRVMSSYDFNDTDAGPPADDNGNIMNVTLNSDNSCGNGWVCEHRWRPIYNMIGFRNIVEGTVMHNWWHGGDMMISYCRGDKGFIAFNNEPETDFNHTRQTCLPAGTYCDIISGDKDGRKCTGKSVIVGSDGTAYIEILKDEEEGVLAIHKGAKL